MKSRNKDLPVILFESQAEWEVWLEDNHAISDGIWMKLAKKDSGVRSVTYQEALDIALCYGWIDGQKGALDERFWLQRFTRRGPRSKWSKINRAKVEKLIAQERMKEPGMREIESARSDGRWEAAYDSPRTMEVPEDLRMALEQAPEALEFFGTLNSTNRYAILYRIQDAKRAETRARRIEQFVAMLREKKTLY